MFCENEQEKDREPSPTTREGLGSPIVAIASSLGGPKVLEKIFFRLTADFPMPIVVVQHIASGGTDCLN